MILHCAAEFRLGGRFALACYSRRQLSTSRCLSAELSSVRLLSSPIINLTGSYLRARGVNNPTPSHRIIKCPYPDINLPRTLLHEFVWEKINNWNDMVALTCGATGRSFTYGMARDASRRFAAALLRQGFSKGDVLAICLPNVPEYALIYLGALEAGLAVTTINMADSLEDVRRQLDNSDARIIVATPGLLPKLRKAAAGLPKMRAFVCLKDDPSKAEDDGDSLRFTELLSGNVDTSSVKFPEVTPEDLAVIPYTSGTTGTPKGVKLSHFNLVTNVLQISHEAFDQGREATESFREVIVTVVPLYHIYGMIVVMLARMRLGAHIVTVPDPTPETYVNCLQKHQSTVLNVTATLMSFLAALPQALPAAALERVHTVMYGGSPMAPDNVARFMGRLRPSVVFQQGYGSTETAGAITQTSRWERKLGTSGYVVPNTRVKVVDPDTGAALGAGHVGHILVRGPQVMMGYLKDEVAQARKFDEEGWLLTGDLGFYDDEHCFHIVERLDEIIHVSGIHSLPVAPAELEEILRGHPGVEDAAVVGVADDQHGSVPRAFVVRRRSGIGRRLKERELLDLIAQRTPPYKHLRGGVRFVEALPKSPTGNVKRYQLRDL